MHGNWYSSLYHMGSVRNVSLMISILLPCYKSAALLRSKTWQSPYDVIRQSNEVELIAYDNGGNDDTLNALKRKWPDFITVLGDGVNVGLNVALNRCAAEAQGAYYYLPHTDMVLEPECLKHLLFHACNLAPRCFMFCSRSIERTRGHTPFHIVQDLGDPDSLQNDIALRNSMNKALTQASTDKAVVTAYRMPFFMSRQLWDKMDGVDENYFSFASDDDLFMTAFHVGVRKFWMINASMVYHMQGFSNAQQTVDRDSRKPYDYFFNKWRSKGYNMTGNIDADMQKLVPWNIKIK